MTLNEDAIREAFAEHYLVRGELGRGGMAYVFCARRRSDDLDVAIKVIRPEIAVGMGHERFQREISVLTPLHHPHIFPLLETGAVGPYLYYTMPCATDGSLKEHLLEEGRLPLSEVIRLAAQIGGALDYAHQHGVIHRDLKPENILSHEGQWALCDFGIARAMEAASSESLSPSGVVIGTPQYLSPEQGAAARKLDARSDIYSFGCVLYEALAGHPPFTGATPQAVIARHAKEHVPKLRTARPDVPEHVEKAIEWALAKRPKDRPKSAGALVGALSKESSRR